MIYSSLRWGWHVLALSRYCDKQEARAILRAADQGFRVSIIHNVPHPPNCAIRAPEHHDDDVSSLMISWGVARTAVPSYHA